VSTFLDERPKPVLSLSRFLVFALIVILAVSGLTARLFYLQIVDGGRLVGIISPSDINRLLQRSLTGRAQAPAGGA